MPSITSIQKYGPFKQGDPAHSAHNKTFEDYKYVEEWEQHKVKYYPRDYKLPIWEHSDQIGKSMVNPQSSPTNAIDDLTLLSN